MCVKLFLIYYLYYSKDTFRRSWCDLRDHERRIRFFKKTKLKVGRNGFSSFRTPPHYLVIVPQQCYLFNTISLGRKRRDTRGNGGGTIHRGAYFLHENLDRERKRDKGGKGRVTGGERKRGTRREREGYPNQYLLCGWRVTGGRGATHQKYNKVCNGYLSYFCLFSCLLLFTDLVLDGGIHVRDGYTK
jgi:hypothetical protein